MWTKMMKMCVALVAVLFLASVLSAPAFAEGWEGELEIKPQSGLGDVKDEIKDSLDGHDFSLIIGTEKTAVTVDGCKIDLGEGCHSVLKVLMDLPREMPALSDELLDKASLSTSDVKAESNIYSSLFTESKYRKFSSSEDTIDILSSRALREVISGITDWDQFTASITDSFEGDITFFQVEEKYLIMLDFSTGGYDYLVKAGYDGFSFSVTAYADVNVTDWDDTADKILAGESETGRGINAFTMIYDDKTENENYLEIDRYAGGESSRLELSDHQTSDSRDLEIVAVYNEKKALKLETEIEASETDLSDAVSPESAMNSLDPAVGQSLIKCIQVICGE
ncbi:MAG: hypothetical protein K6F61_01295 [Clostridiales bacterium]|nr:hypothetical protein [Clostridiales bacterium]